jgi:hypothetical protein
MMASSRSLAISSVTRTPLIVQALVIGTMSSPWPPRTIVRTSLTLAFASRARKSEKRALSRTPAMPTTLFRERPVRRLSS